MSLPVRRTQAAPWLKHALWRKAQAVPSLDLRFADNKSLVDSVSGQNLITFSRASTGTYIDSTGALRTAVVNEPRFDHNPLTGESLGLLVEEPRTNSIRNNTMVGAVAGTPGTLPTNWNTYLAPTGITRTVVGTGVSNGVSYIDIRLNGTASGAGELSIYPEASSALLFTAGTVVSNSTWLAITSGSTSNITAISLRTISYAGGAYLSEGSVTAALTSTLTRFAHNGYTTALTSDRVTTVISVTVTAAGAIDFTLRIGFPQLEQGAFATSAIPTTTAAATRSADVVEITGSNFSGWYRQDEGTWFVDSRKEDSSTAQHRAAVYAGNLGAANRVETRNYSIGANARAYINDAGTTQADFTQLAGIAASSPLRTALGVKANDFAASTNGATPQVDTSGTVPVVDRLEIGSSVGNINYINGHIRRLTYFPARLPNTALQRLTQ